MSVFDITDTRKIFHVKVSIAPRKRSRFEATPDPDKMRVDKERFESILESYGMKVTSASGDSVTYEGKVKGGSVTIIKAIYGPKFYGVGYYSYNIYTKDDDEVKARVDENDEYTLYL